MTKINKACEAYKIFDAFKITENMKISDYILEFDKPSTKHKSRPFLPLRYWTMQDSPHKRNN